MDGILYLNSGTKLLPRLWVSLATCRDQWKGPITVLTAEMPQTAIDLLNKHGFQTQPITIPPGGAEALLAKTYLAALSPFDRTWFLDSDTMILKSPQPCFDTMEDMTWTEFSTWKMSHKAMSRRVKNVMDVAGIYNEEDFTEATNPERPGLNIGSFGWVKGYHPEFFEEWHALAAKVMGQVFIHDESAAMTLIWKYPHKFLPYQYNFPCNRPGTFTIADAQKATILHLAGRAHTSKEKSHGINSLWVSAAKKMYARDRMDFKTILDTYHYKNELSMILEA